MIALLLFLLKSTFVLGSVLLLCRFINPARISAAQRHGILCVALVGLPLLLVLGQISQKTLTFDPPALILAMDLDVAVVPNWPSPIINAGPTVAVTDPSISLWLLVRSVYALVATGLLVTWLVRLFTTSRWIGVTHAVRLPAQLPVPGYNTDAAALKESAQIDAPITWGVLRPEIVLPKHWPSWSMPKLNAVLAHEHAHVTRRDTLTLVLCNFICSVFWFQPLVWWVRRRVQLEAEQACDDSVVRRGLSALSYAQQLVEIAKAQRSSRAALAMATPHTLPPRIHALLDRSTHRESITMKYQFKVTILVLSVVGLLSTIDANADKQLSGDGLSVASGTDADLMPLVKVSPIYPADARQQGIEGFVEVEFVVNATGRIEDAKIVEASPVKVFDAAALAALSYYRYKPRVVHGIAVAVPGVRTRFAFDLDGGGSAERTPLTQAPGMGDVFFTKIQTVQSLLQDRSLISAADHLEEMMDDREGYNASEKGQLHNLAGYLAFLNEDNWGAITEYEQVLAQGDAIPEGLRITTLYTVAQLHFVNAEYSAALKYIQEWADEAESPGPIPLVFMAQTYYQLNDYANAIENLEEGTQLAQTRGIDVKENWWALLNYLYFEEKNWSEVVRVLEILNRDFPSEDYANRLTAVRRILADAESTGSAPTL